MPEPQQHGWLQPFFEAAAATMIAPFDHRPPRAGRCALAPGPHLLDLVGAEYVLGAHGMFGFGTVGVNSASAFAGVMPHCTVKRVGPCRAGRHATTGRAHLAGVVTPTFPFGDRGREILERGTWRC